MSEETGVRDILIATGNPGKFKEIAVVLSKGRGDNRLARVAWKSLSDLPFAIDEPGEDQKTFVDNAALKARHYSRATGLWTLADDSGLEVDALGGKPGVLSARYGESPPGTSRDAMTRANNKKLIAALKNAPPEKRQARFRCALALADGDRILATAEGSVEGTIIDKSRGTGGFGYDPHFFLPGLGKTMAELTPEHKNRISHRGQALAQMRERLAALLSQGQTP